MTMLTEASSSSACSSEPPTLAQRRRHPLEQFGRRRDRIGGDEADAAADRAVAGRLVAADQPARIARRRRLGQARHEFDRGGSVDPGLQREQIRLQPGVAALPRVAHGGFERGGGQPGERSGQPERDHVDPAAGDRLGHLLQRRLRRSARRRRGRPRVPRPRRCRRSIRPAGTQRNLVGKPMHVLPVDGQQQVEAIVQRFDRPRRRGAPAPLPRRRGSAARWCAPSARRSPPWRRPRAASSRRS